MIKLYYQVVIDFRQGPDGDDNDDAGDLLARRDEGPPPNSEEDSFESKGALKRHANTSSRSSIMLSA